jgi:ATP-binding cassette, subfamily B, bacterial PglK
MLQTVKTSLRLLTRRQRIGYLLLLATRVLVNFLDIAGVAVVGLLGAAGASGFLGNREASFFGITIDIGNSGVLLTVMALVAAFFLLKAVLSVVLIRTTSYFLANIEVKNASEIAQFLFTGGLTELREYSKSEVQWAVTGSTNVTFSGVLGSAGVLVTETSLLLFMFGLFVIVDPVAAIAITVYFLFVVFIFHLLSSQRMVKSGQDFSEGSVDITQISLDMFEAFKEISVLMKQFFFLERFRTARQTFAYGDAEMRFLMAIPRYFVETALALGALAFVAWQLSRGEVTDGLVTAGVFLAGGVRMMAALLPLQNAVLALKNQVEQAKLSQEILQKSRLAKQQTLSVLESSKDSMLAYKESNTGVRVNLGDVTFTHPGGSKPAVRNVTLSIAPGSYVALVGPSGAGKTTLADLILGLNTAQSGTVTVDKIPARGLRESRPGLMAYVPQRPGLVSGTLVENIALGLPPEAIDYPRVESALKKARLEEFVNDLPDGVHTRLGKNLDSLSGGQVQRLGLARALYTNPKLIVLDEATSALDAKAEASISDSIHSIGQDTTVVVIAHRLSTVQRADQVHVIDDGKLVASGTFKQLRKSVPMIQEYVRLMSFDED